MKKYIAFVLFIFVQQSVLSQGNPADIPSLLTQLSQSNSDTQRIHIYTDLAGSYIVPGRSVNRMDSAAFYLKKAGRISSIFPIPALQNRIDLFSALLHCLLFSSDDVKAIFLPVIDSCKKRDDPLTEAQAWMYLGSMIAEDLPSNTFKLTCYKNAEALARQAGDNYTEIKLQGLIAYAHVLQNKFDLAEKELFLVLQEGQKVSPAITMQADDQLTFLYLSKGELNKSLQYALQTQQMMGISGDSTSAALFYHRLTSIYGALGKSAERDEWGKRELEFKLGTENIPGVYSNIDALGDLMREEGDPEEVLSYILKKIHQQKPSGINDERKVQHALGDAYYYYKRYDQAEKSYLEMIRLGNQQLYNFSISDRAFDEYKIGRFYFDRGFYKKARPYLVASQKNYVVYGVLPYIRFAEQLLFTIDSAMGNYVEAIRHIREYDRIGDSIFKMDRNKQIEELQVAYRTEQKDKNFRLLEGKDQLTNIQLKHSQSTRNWIILGALLLLIIASLLYRQAWIQKNNNKVINDKNIQLQHLVNEKEWLVKEIHHRVKNNLQTVMGLLGTQSGYLRSEEAIKAIADTRHRIESMSLIHQRLYQSNNLSAIKMNDYVHELINSLSESFDTGNRILFSLEIGAIELDLAHCIPIGLILNEAITNSFKYAFPDRRSGVISIGLKNTFANNFLLVIKDDGIGFLRHTDVTGSASMGMNLMRGLSDEIAGKFNLSGENGVTIGVEFIYEPEMFELQNTIVV